jgi:hypothetical protein
LSSEVQRFQRLGAILRKGLQSSAREWYFGLPTETRSSWPELREKFQANFPLNVISRDPGLALAINTFDRRQGKKLSTFIARATKLLIRASSHQLKTLRYQIYTFMAANGNLLDIIAQGRVTERLIADGMLLKMNEFKDECSFNRLREEAILCAMRPGQEVHLLKSIIDQTIHRIKRTHTRLVLFD